MLNSFLWVNYTSRVRQNTPDICGDGKKQRSLLFFYFAGNHKRVITYN